MATSEEHWEHVYESTPDAERSWARKDLKESLNAIDRVAPRIPCAIIDIGGGVGDDSITSHVAFDDGAGYILDISAAALGINSDERDQWISVIGLHYSFCVGDVLTAPLPQVEVWHDRATMHFLTDVKDRRRYVERAADHIVPGGGIIVSGFSTEGPTHCSGLEVLRRSPSELTTEFAEYFDVIDAYEADHITPGGVVQRFAWYLGRRK